MHVGLSSLAVRGVFSADVKVALQVRLRCSFNFECFNFKDCMLMLINFRFKDVILSICGVYFPWPLFKWGGMKWPC